MRILIIGLGRSGLRHAAHLRSLDVDIQLAGWQQHSSNRADLPVSTESLFEEIFFDQRSAIQWHPELAIIASPSTVHLSTAVLLARAGINIFVEKPLTDSVEGVPELLDICHRTRVGLTVGYNLRFDRALQTTRNLIRDGRLGRVLTLRAAVGQYLPNWRPERNYTNTPTARRELGGGVVLELSHELDYCRWLVGEIASVQADVSTSGDLDINVEDNAEIILRFTSGVVGTIHLDCLDHATTRTCRIVGTEGTIVWDGISGSAQVFSSAEKKWTTIQDGEADRNRTYAEEMRHLIAGRGLSLPPAANGEDGFAVLKIAEAVKHASHQRTEAVL